MADTGFMQVLPVAAAGSDSICNKSYLKKMEKIFRNIFFASLLFAAACNENKTGVAKANVFDDPILYCKTVKELNNVVKQNNFPPIIASRNYVYANIAAYEVIALHDKRFGSLAGQIKHLPALPKPETANVNFEFASLLAFCKVGEAVTFYARSLQYHTALID